MSQRLNRFELLVGKDKVSTLKNKVVLICGLGGVGGTCLESLARSGVGTFIIVDYDIVDVTNLNRLILFESADIGLLKVNSASEKLKRISQDITIYSYPRKVDVSLLSILDKHQIDFAIDAIDSPLAKEILIEYCLAHKIPFISSLGMANRLDPTAVRVGNLSDTKEDPLAKKMRLLLRRKLINLADIPVVYSFEKPLVSGPTLASVMNVPSAAGLALAYYCLENLLK